MIIAGFLATMMELSVWYSWQLAAASLLDTSQNLRVPALWAQVTAITVGFIVAERLHRRKVSLGRLRAFVGAGGLTLACVLGPLTGVSPIFGLSVTFFLWWRGAVTAQYYRYHGALTERFFILALCLVASLLAVSSDGATAKVLSRLSAASVGFFTAALLALAAARMTVLRGEIEDAGESVAQEKGLRLHTAAGVMALLVAVPTVLGWLLTGRDAALGLGAFLRSLFLKVADLLFFCLMPLLTVVGRLIEPLVGWLADRSLKFPEVRLDTPSEGLPEVRSVTALPHWLVWSALALATFVVGTILVYVFMNSIWLRLETGDEEVVRETRESLWSWDEFLGPVARLRLRRPGFFVARVQPEARHPVREAYRRLLAFGLMREVPRRSHETPYEYASRFSSATGAPREAVDLITEAYVRLRYGDLDASREELNEMERCLMDVLKALQSVARTPEPSPDDKRRTV